MGPYVLLYSSLIGLFASAAVYHLAWWWITSRQPLLIVFAMRCLVLTVFSVILVRLITATDLADAQALDYWRGIALPLAVPPGVWTLALASGVRARAFLWTITAIFLAMALGGVLGMPFTGPIVRLETTTFPWGETITTTLRGDAPGFGAIAYLLVLAVDLFGLYCSHRLWRSDPVAGVLMAAASVGGVASDVLASRVDVLGLKGFYVGALNSAISVVLLAVITGRILRRRERESAAQLELQQVRQGELERRLEKAQRLESIGRLAGGIAHDFNNVLTVINGHAEALLSRLGGQPELRHEAQRIRDASERAKGLTSQLLAFSRHSVVETRVLSVNESVRDAGQILRRLIGEQITVTIRAGLSDPKVQMNPSQMGQILLNLAVNARDAMAGGGELVISVDRAVLDLHGRGQTPCALVSISDTGVGIKPEVLPSIFDPFFTTKENAGGTGLGLSVVHGIVTQAGGRIDVESTVGGGTTFTIAIPEVDAVPDTSSPTPPSLIRGGNETLLLIEDDDDVRAVVGGMLTAHGYRVLTAGDAGEARQHMASSAIDVVVSDVMLPGLSGPDLAIELLKQQPRLAVVFMSGYAPENVGADRVATLDAEFVAKPFTAMQLGMAVRAALLRAESRVSGPA